MKLSVIIPTGGRQTIIPLISELIVQMIGGLDEIIVVADGFGAYRAELNIHTRVRNVYTKHTGKWGCHQRNAGMMLATGTHLAFLDDDDTVAPNYVQRIKEGVLDEDALHLFRMEHSDPKIGVIWKEREIKHMNVSTQMIVVPNNIYKTPLWQDHCYESDLIFCKHAEAAFGKIVWHDEIVAFQNGGIK